MKYIKHISNFINETFDPYNVNKKQLIEACRFFIEKCKTDNSIEITLDDKFSDVYMEAYNTYTNDRSIIEDIDIMKLLLDFKNYYPDVDRLLQQYVILPGK